MDHLPATEMLYIRYSAARLSEQHDSPQSQRGRSAWSFWLPTGTHKTGGHP